MKLREYIYFSGSSVRKMAQEVGCSPQVIMSICNDSPKPNLKAVKKIVELTKGTVDYKDMLPEELLKGLKEYTQKKGSEV